MEWGVDCQSILCAYLLMQGSACVDPRPDISSLFYWRFQSNGQSISCILPHEMRGHPGAGYMLYKTVRFQTRILILHSILKLRDHHRDAPGSMGSTHASQVWGIRQIALSIHPCEWEAGAFVVAQSVAVGFATFNGRRY